MSNWPHIQINIPSFIPNFYILWVNMHVNILIGIVTIFWIVFNIFRENPLCINSYSYPALKKLNPCVDMIRYKHVRKYLPNT